MKIQELKINPKIITNLEQLGYVELTEIQQAAIPLILENKNILAQAQTGSGKTAAFVVPIIDMISRDHKKKALIVAPTRDLAMQIFENTIKYAKTVGVKTGCFYGGSSYSKQISFLEAGVDIIIGTPGRLIDLYKRKRLNLADVNFLVLDEADQMLDMGFVDDIRDIVKFVGQCDQISMFSATMPKQIMKLVLEIIPEHENIHITSKINVNDVIKQTAYLSLPSNKPKLLLDILGDSERTKQQAIVFTRTKNEASQISMFLKDKGFKVEALHSDRSQSSRTRAMKMFRENIVQVLIATNVAARGIDITDLPLVINYNLPENRETYVHRIGRTGRVGKQGEAISFITRGDLGLLRDIEKLIKMKIAVIEEQKYMIKDVNNTISISSYGHSEDENKFSRDRKPFRKFGDSGRSSFGPRRSFGGDGEKREFSDRRRSFGSGPDGEKREFPDRRRSFGFGADGEKREFPDRRRSFGSGPDGEKREFSDRRRSFGGDGEKREFPDRRRSFGGDGEKREFPDRRRSFGGDGEKREFPDRRRSFGGDGEKREFSGERRKSFGAKSFDRKPSWDKDGSSDGFTKKSYDSRKSYSDKHKKNDDKNDD